MFGFFCYSSRVGKWKVANSHRWFTFFIPFCQTVFTPCLWTVALKTRQTLDTTHYEKQSLLNIFKQIWTAAGHFFVIFSLEFFAGKYNVQVITTHSPSLQRTSFINPEKKILQFLDITACQQGKCRVHHPLKCIFWGPPPISWTVAQLLRFVETIPFLKTVFFAFTFCRSLSSVCKLERWTFYQNHVASMGTSLALITACACDLRTVCVNSQDSCLEPFTKTVPELSIHSAAIDCVDFDQPSWQQFFGFFVKSCGGWGVGRSHIHICCKGSPPPPSK